jgi:hypothetical protein
MRIEVGGLVLWVVAITLRIIIYNKVSRGITDATKGKDIG